MNVHEALSAGDDRIDAIAARLIESAEAHEDVQAAARDEAVAAVNAKQAAQFEAAVSTALEEARKGSDGATKQGENSQWLH